MRYIVDRECRRRIVFRNGEHCAGRSSLLLSWRGPVDQIRRIDLSGAEVEVYRFIAFVDRVIDDGNIDRLAGLSLFEDHSLIRVGIIRAG